jgi:murein DD-endopeptidase MepM/ murein hydrolase activator NlpD
MAISVPRLTQISSLTSDVKVYFRLWYLLLRRWSYGLFSGFESAKDLLVAILYKQRGRFARPFVHTGMVGLSAVGIMLAPFIATSTPAIFAQEGPTPAPVVLSASTQVEPETTIFSDKYRDKIIPYTVESGDTLSGISVKFGISIDTIVWQNDLTDENQTLKPGQVLEILPVTGIAHTVGQGDTIYSIAKKYKADPQSIADFPFNTFSDDETFALSVGQVLIVPDGVKPQAPAIAVQPPSSTGPFTPSVGITPGTGQFIWPVAGIVTQRFSWYHKAIDIANPNYPPVYAADGGTVIVAGWIDNTGYGNRVMIDHGNGFITLYGHLSKIIVGVGQHVNKGQQIGFEGSTGRSTGPHLHFEIRRTNGSFENPLAGWLK